MSTQTKQVFPWQLKPGTRLVPLHYAPGHAPSGNRDARYVLGTVVSVQKRRGIFTGASVWLVRTDKGELLTYHGKGRMLPAERIWIYCN